MTPYFFDSHAHLSADGLDDVLARAKAVGVTDIVCIGASDGYETNVRTLELMTRPGLHATVGIHPHDASVVTEQVVEDIEALSRHERVVAIGEIGLDYHYDHSPRDVQEDVFRRFLRVAHRRGLPVVIHTREAEEDTVRILQEEDAAALGGVIHCFTGTEYLAREAVALGFYVSFSGVLTFKSADALRAIATWLPRDRVLVETDCPYLSPVPMRGKPNEPSYVVHTAAKLAELWGTELAEVKQLTGENAARLFRVERDARDGL